MEVDTVNMSYVIAKKHPAELKKHTGIALQEGCIYRKSSVLGPFPCLTVDFEIASHTIKDGDTIVVLEATKYGLQPDRQAYKIIHNGTVFYILKDHVTKSDFELVAGADDGI